MIVEVIDSLDGLEKLKLEWLRLWQSCPTATPFQSPQWLIPWTRHIFGGGRICCLAIRQSSTLVGLAPLFTWGTDRRILSFLGAGISDYGDVLLVPGHEAECMSTLRRLLSDQIEGGCDLDLRDIREGSMLLDGWPREECAICPVLDLSSYPASMDPKHRTDVRRARNRFAKMPSVSYERAEAANLTERMHEFFLLHEARWTPLGETLRSFHLEVAHAFLETGDLRLSVLRVGDKPAAAIYAFRCGKSLYCYLSGFDPDMAKLSPGAALLGWVVEEAIEEGAREVDFLRDGEAYKYLWGAVNRTSYSIRVEGQG